MRPPIAASCALLVDPVPWLSRSSGRGRVDDAVTAANVLPAVPASRGTLALDGSGSHRVIRVTRSGRDGPPRRGAPCTSGTTESVCGGGAVSFDTVAGIVRSCLWSWWSRGAMTDCSRRLSCAGRIAASSEWGTRNVPPSNGSCPRRPGVGVVQCVGLTSRRLPPAPAHQQDRARLTVAAAPYPRATGTARHIAPVTFHSRIPSPASGRARPTSQPGALPATAPQPARTRHARTCVQLGRAWRSAAMSRR